MLFRYDIKTSNQHFMAKSVVSSKRHLRKGKALMAKLKTKEMYEEDEDFPKDEEASQQFAILILEILFYLDLYIYIHIHRYLHLSDVYIDSFFVYSYLHSPHQVSYVLVLSHDGFLMSSVMNLLCLGSTPFRLPPNHARNTGTTLGKEEKSQGQLGLRTAQVSTSGTRSRTKRWSWLCPVQVGHWAPEQCPGLEEPVKQVRRRS